MLPLLSFAGAGAAKAAGGWNCFIAGTPVLAAAGVIAGERLVADALPAEYKTWNVPVMLGSGALIFLGAVQVARMLRDKRSNDESAESDLIIVKRRLLLPDSQFGWI